MKTLKIILTIFTDKSKKPCQFITMSDVFRGSYPAKIKANNANRGRLMGGKERFVRGGPSPKSIGQHRSS